MSGLTSLATSGGVQGTPASLPSPPSLDGTPPSDSAPPATAASVSPWGAPPPSLPLPAPFLAQPHAALNATAARIASRLSILVGEPSRALPSPMIVVAHIR